MGEAMIATNTSKGLLSRPIPDGRSDRYASGWAYADGHLRKGGHLNAAAPADWHEEKAAGFSDRLVAERDALAHLSKVHSRTHCDCGAELDPVASAGGNWGSWRCRKCWAGYCQDCGSQLDGYNDCIAYREQQDEDAQDAPEGSA